MEATKFPPEECTSNGQRMFTIQKDGDGNEHKVVNFNNPQMVPNTGTVIIEAIRKKMRHTPSANHKAWRDPLTDIWWGIPAGLHPKTKNIRWLNIEISDMRVFDLTIPQDRKEWAVISRASFYANSPNALSSYKPSHKVVNKENEAVAKIQTTKGLVEAIKIIDQLSELQIIDMARNIGRIDVKQNSPVLIKADLYDRVTKNPKEFLDVWHAANRQVLNIFRRCEATGLISFEANEGNWMWKKSVALGATEPSAIDFISKNNALMMAMDTESKARDDKYQDTATEEEKKPFVVPGVLHANVNKETMDKQERLIARMELKEKELDAILEKAKTAQVIDIETPLKDSFGETPVYVKSATSAPSFIDNSLKESELGADEMRSLQDRARKMGMVHAYTVKDPAKIYQWIRGKEVDNQEAALRAASETKE